METAAYACKLKDLKDLKSSSSGGAFTAFSDIILDDGGAVACSIYDYDSKELKFQIVENKEDRDKARGSKYFQSIPGEVYNNCLEWIKLHPQKKLLFVGMGCQVDAFRRFICVAGEMYLSNIFFIDIICHGVPSPQMWKEYVSSIEKKNKSIVDFITFKDKRNGWKSPTAYAKMGKSEISLHSYVRAFNAHCMLRDCCHYCPYTTVERKSDITIGDFWGIEKTHLELLDNMGVSLVLVHSNKGKYLFEQTLDTMEQMNVSLEECLQPRLKSPTPIADYREKFWKEYKHNGVEFVIKKYGELKFIDRVKRKVRSIIHRY